MPVESEMRAEEFLTGDPDITVSATREGGRKQMPNSRGMGEEKLETRNNDNYLEKFCCKGKKRKGKWQYYL